MVDPARAANMETTVFASAPRTLENDPPNRDEWSETLCDALARYSQPLSDRCVGKSRTP